MNEIKLKILITGATGFIGSHLVEELINNNHKISILKRSTSNLQRIQNSLGKIKSFDLDTENLKEIFDNNNFDVLIHLATNYGRKNKSTPEIFKTNLILPLELFELAEKNQLQYFFNIDTCLNKEINNYAHSKSILREIFSKNKSKNCKILNLKLFHIFGENDCKTKFIPFAISKLKKNEEIDMTSGEQKLDLLYVKEACKMINFLIKNRKKYNKNFQTIELGSGKQITLKNFIQLIHKNLNSKSIINFGKISHRKNENMDFKADLSTLQNYQFSFTLEQAIKMTLNG